MENTGSSHLKSGHIWWFFFHADVKMYKTSMFDLEQGFRGVSPTDLIQFRLWRRLTETYATQRFFLFSYARSMISEKKINQRLCEQANCRTRFFGTRREFKTQFNLIYLCKMTTQELKKNERKRTPIPTALKIPPLSKHHCPLAIINIVTVPERSCRKKTLRSPAFVNQN